MSKAPVKTAPKKEEQEVITSVDVGAVTVSDRLRSVDENWVAQIADSFDAFGQQTPILVTPSDKGGYRLVAGAHRLAAAKKLGWEIVDCKVVEGDDLELRLREIDENLLRRELSQLDRAAHLAERQRIYEEINPDSKRGKSGALARWMQAQTISFASETAEKCGLSERSIQLSIQRFNRIAPDVRERIALTPLADKGVELDALAKLEPDEQRKAIELIFSEDNDAPRSINEASKIIRGVREIASNADSKDADFESFTRKWSKNIYSAQTKRNILAWLEAEGHLSGSSDEEEEFV